MTEMRMFYQERADGGRRSGLYADGESVLATFVPGSDEPDPRLLWSVDLVWQVESPPRTDDEAIDWVGDHAEDARAAIAQTAEQVRAGIDPDFYPWQQECPTPGGSVRVIVSAMRRLAGLEVGARLRRLAAEWPPLRVARPAPV